MENLSLLASRWRGCAERGNAKLASRVYVESSGMGARRGSEDTSSCWSGAGITLMGERKKHTQKKMGLPCKTRMSWRQNPVTCVRTDWFHVRLLNGASVWRRHWPSVEGCTSQESCWVTSTACDWRLLPQHGPPWPIHLDGEVKDGGTSCHRRPLPAP